ncbi:MAG: glycosyltransferase, partial [Candidatus Neomarinimicrobiota bacterium]
MDQILIVFQVCLAVYLLALLWFLAGLFKADPERTTERPMVSVIVAARNGNQNLRRLLPMLQEQEYPLSKLEIIFADDGLSSGSRGYLQEAARNDTRLKVVDSSAGDSRLNYKKRALDAAIKHSQGELLLFTDVDCMVEPQWVSTMASYFRPGIDYVVGWSQVGAESEADRDALSPLRERPLAVFEQMDFLMLMLAARGTALQGIPLASSGQNQAYRRSVYERTGGFIDLAGHTQGDDSLYLQLARRKAKSKVTFAVDPAGRAVTEPLTTVADFLRQRIRWAGDAAAMWRYNPLFLPIAIATFGANALLLILVPLSFINPGAVLPVLVPGLV